jgi:hypothetical protein
MRRLAATAVALALGLALAGPAAAQCAMCKTALISSPEGQRLASDFNRAILVMLFAPYLVSGAFLAVFFREKIRDRVRRALRRTAAGG